MSDDRLVHAVARALCFKQHGDWRYEPGKLTHEKWRDRARELLHALDRAGLDVSRKCQGVEEALRDA